MCGIAGIISSNPSLVTIYRLKKMADSLAHRGPDGEGFCINNRVTAGFAHRRLSIIDLSDNAAQPMQYLSRYMILHNGEIYNYRELREDLQQKGYAFRTQSDTEVILAAYDFYKTGCLEHFDGMFAFTIWDEQEQQLFAARDRFGEKPFYYSDNGVEFIFGSEIKALSAAGVDKKVDESLVLNFLAIGNMAADASKSFYQNINCLPQAHYLLLTLERPGYGFEIKRYWDIKKEDQSNGIPATDLTNSFREKFFLSVTRRLRSDVSIGTSLSGGLDSSSIAAAISHIGFPAHPLKTFSAVFPGFEKDESRYIQQMVRFCGLQNYTVTPTGDDFIKDFEKLLYHHEEPVSSMSIYAQFKVFELAKQHDIKVLLDGQGADELMAGYTKYIHWYLQELIATGHKKQSREAITALRENNIPFNWGWRNYAAAIWPATTARKLTVRAVSAIKHHPFIAEDFLQSHIGKNAIYKPVVKKLNDILYFDTTRSGLPELLRYADRNSMAHSREVRLPFLNHQLAEFLFSLPSSSKIQNGYTKHILRVAMEDALPPQITWRKDKVAFEPPQQQWMENNILQENIQEAKKVLVYKGILKDAVLQKKIQPLDAHAAENYDWRYLVLGSLLR